MIRMKRTTTTVVVQEELEVSRFEDDNMTSSPDDKIHDRGNLSQDKHSSGTWSDQIRSIEDFPPTDKNQENFRHIHSCSVDSDSLPSQVLEEPLIMEEEIVCEAPDSTKDSSTNSQERNTKGRKKHIGSDYIHYLR